MRPYAIIDLHCDTLTDCMYAASEIPDTLDDPARSLSLSNIPEDVHWAQFFAVFLPDRLRGEEAVRFFDASHENFERQIQHRPDALAGPLCGVHRPARAEQLPGIGLTAPDDAFRFIQAVRALDLGDVQRLATQKGFSLVAGHMRPDHP